MSTFRIGACLSFAWAEELVNDMNRMLNDRTDGLWDDLIDDDNITVEIKWYNDKDDSRQAVEEYWNTIRNNWDSQPPHGMVGCRTSDSSEGLAQITSLEDIPLISPSSTSYRLEAFKNFFRTIAPDDENGQVGALVSLLEYMKWNKVTILGTDSLYSRDFAAQFSANWTSLEGKTIVHDFFISNASITEDIKRAFDDISTDPAIKSRIILLIASEYAATQILQVATDIKFQPDTIWISTDGWTDRISVPGESSMALGLKTFVEKGELYGRFFQNSFFQRSNEYRTTGLPIYAAETVDAVLAFVYGLNSLSPENRNDGTKLIEALTKINFTGITGQVQFDQENRFKVNPKFHVDYGGKSQDWTDVGTIQGNNVTFTSPETICWPSPWGCGLKNIPPDFYTVPTNYLFHFIFIPMSLILLGLLSYILFHKKKMTEMEKKLNEKYKIDEELLQVSNVMGSAMSRQATLVGQRALITDRPSSWKETESILVPILPSDEEYWNVHSNLQGTSEQMQDAWISKVWRIQNINIWAFYSFRLESLKQLLGQGGLNETMVWHGTRDIDPSLIYNDVQDGFMTQFSRKGSWGRGIYFASESSYSHDFAYQPHQDAQGDRPPNEGNEREMFFTKLLAGSVYSAVDRDKTLTVPPLMPNQKTKRYNTVQGYSQDSKIWVVYENGRAYPEYLVRYYIGPRDPKRTPFSSREESLKPPPPPPQLEVETCPPEASQVHNFVWQFEDDDEWQSFNDELQTTLETAYQMYKRESHWTDSATIKYKLRKWEYKIDFCFMIQTNISHPNRKERFVRRFDGHIV